MSKNYNSWECSRIRSTQDVDCKKNCCKCEVTHPKAMPVILAANAGEDVNLVDGNCPGKKCPDKEELASVAMDTSCLVNPLIKIDFTTNIIFKGADLGCDAVNTFIRVSFKLIKCCNGCSEKIGTWEYYRYFANATDLAIAKSLSDTFTFNYCTTDSCPGCCIYKVVAKVKACDDVYELTCKKNTISVIAQSQN